MSILEFHASEALTLGVELELQLVDRRDGDLTCGATDLLRIVDRPARGGEIKLEITESMVEVSTGVHRTHPDLLADLRALVSQLQAAGDVLDIGVCGGGAHPFQHWPDRQIAGGERFTRVADLYGYLAKQFTVFGQHVHIGCPDGDAAVRLVHGLAGYVPQFIALAASSPLLQGMDTGFDCARMNAVASFPLSGRMPAVHDWQEFQAYFERMRRLGVVESMKDFYWDIRPKPEYGTVEIRVFDTPIDLERAAALAVFSQAVAALLLKAPACSPPTDADLVYSVNRFQACRFGLDGVIIDPATRARVRIGDAVRTTLDRIEHHLPCEPIAAALAEIGRILETGNDATAIRRKFAALHSLPGLIHWARGRLNPHARFGQEAPVARTG